MKPDLTHHLGRRVEVEIDRPLGSRHPRDPDLVYPVNYGELPGTVSGDGHPIDAYVLGVAVPLERFSGVVVAVVLRQDDAEDKLVVAPEGVSLTAQDIAAAVEFQERFFVSRVVLRAQAEKNACSSAETSSGRSSAR